MTSIIKVNTFQDTNGNALFNSDGSGNVTLSAGAMKNTPAFKARKTSDQSITHGATAKALYETEDLDTDSAFASSRFTVPSGKDGEYFFSWSFDIINTSNQLEAWNTYLYKNGSSVFETVWNSGNSSNVFRRINHSYSCIQDAVASDYFEIYFYFFFSFY